MIAIASDKLRDGKKGGVELFRLEEVVLGPNKWGNPTTSVVVVPVVKTEGSAMGPVVDDEPGDTTDQLTADQNAQEEAKSIAFCEAIVNAMKPVARISGDAVFATVAEVAERLPALAKLKAESGPNFARNVRQIIMGGEPKVLLANGWLEFSPSVGRKPSLFTFTARKDPKL
ncbi:MAG: hypothetical protein U5N53_09030 [Mycobacterium sp.]|nr:hypothetical protein [Mycobacterium sp.]